MVSSLLKPKLDVMMKTLGIIIVVAIAIVALGSLFSGGGQKVSKNDYGNLWPFEVDEGVVDCEKGNAAVFKANGKTYVLNGFADAKGYTDLEPIWRENPDVPGTRINLGDFITLALENC